MKSAIQKCSVRNENEIDVAVGLCQKGYGQSVIPINSSWKRSGKIKAGQCWNGNSKSLSA